MACDQAAIDKLETLLNSGASEITVDGEKVKLDTASMERRLAQLKSECADEAAGGASNRFGIRRSRVSLPNALGG